MPIRSHRQNYSFGDPPNMVLPRYYLRPCRSSAVRRWLLTAAARVRVRAACGVCGGQSGTGGRFSPSTSVSTANHSTEFSIIIITRCWHNRPSVAAVSSGPNWTPPPTIPIFLGITYLNFRHSQNIGRYLHCRPTSLWVSS
jgi:hypothetical protein